MALWFAVISLACGFAGQFFLYTRQVLLPGLILFAAGIVFFIKADKTSAAIEKSDISKKNEIIIFCLIMALAVFFRVFRLDQVPAGCFVDEAQNGFDAQNILKGSLPVYIGFSTHNAALFLYMIADVFKIFGPGATQVRVVSAALGILTVPAFYFLLRHLFGVRPALLGAFFLAVLRWHVNFSRIGFHAAFALFVFVLVLYFVCRAYKSRKWIDFIALGISLGISQNTYQAARLIPVWLFLAVVYLFIKDRGFFTGNYKKIIAAAAIAVTLSLPIINYAVNNPKVFFRRQGEVNIFTKGAVDNSYRYSGKYTPVSLFFQNMKDTVLMFNYKGDTNARHNIPGKPVLDFTMGVFMLLGFGYMLFKIADPAHLFFISIFAVFVVAGFMTIEAPQSLRVIFTIPAIVAFAAVSFDRLFGIIERSFAKASGKVFIAAAAVIAVLTAGVSSYRIYFNEQATNPFCWHDFATNAYTAGKYYKGLGPGWRAALNVEFDKRRTFNMAASGEDIDNYDDFVIDGSIPAKPADKKNYVYILPPNYSSLVEPVFKAIYPGGRYVPFYNKYSKDWMIYFAYEVPYEEIARVAAKKEVNGLMLTRYASKDLTGKPFSVKYTPAVFLDPDYGGFSCEWNGRLKVEKHGLYAIIAKSKGKSAVFIDGKKIVENEGDANAFESSKGVIYLEKGFHKLRTTYSQGKIFAAMELWWMPPEEGEKMVPYSALFK